MATKSELVKTIATLAQENERLDQEVTELQSLSDGNRWRAESAEHLLKATQAALDAIGKCQRYSLRCAKGEWAKWSDIERIMQRGESS